MIFGNSISTEHHIETETCYACKHSWHFKVWDTINVTQNPELKEMLRDESFMMRVCPYCGNSVFSRDCFTYVDMERRLVARVGDWETPDYSWLKGQRYPESLYENYALRCIGFLYELKEKIAIIDAGLNDIAVAIVKYFLRYRMYPKEFYNSYHFIFVKRTFVGDESDRDERLVFSRREMGFNQEVLFKISMDYYDKAMDYVRNDPRFKDKGVLYTDEQWVKWILEGLSDYHHR